MNETSSGVRGVRKTLNTVYIAEKKCTGGKWQDNKYPCHHAVAYFSLWKGMSIENIL